MVGRKEIENKERKFKMNMSLVYNWKTKAGLMVVEYCCSVLNNNLKIVGMTLAGKFHRFTWMPEEAQDELMNLLEQDYYNITKGGK